MSEVAKKHFWQAHERMADLVAVAYILDMPDIVRFCEPWMKQYFAAYLKGVR